MCKKREYPFTDVILDNNCQLLNEFGHSYCRTKLNVTKEQLADQRAYVQQLKATEADETVIEREKTVEKQLRKKEVQMTELLI